MNQLACHKILLPHFFLLAFCFPVHNRVYTNEVVVYIALFLSFFFIFLASHFMQALLLNSGPFKFLRVLRIPVPVCVVPCWTPKALRNIQLPDRSLNLRRAAWRVGRAWPFVIAAPLRSEGCERARLRGNVSRSAR